MLSPFVVRPVHRTARGEALPLGAAEEVQHYWLPTIHAAVALDGRKAQEAIELLRTIGSYELSIECGLDPVYVRGLAYLMQDNGNAAGVEFQKIIDHPGLAGIGL